MYETEGPNLFLELGRDPAVLDIVSAALGTDDIFLWAAQIFCKPPGTGRTVPWHQDGQYWPIEPLQALTAWVAVDSSTKSNGCLQVLPGSHGALYPHEQRPSVDAAIDFVIQEDVFTSGRLNESNAHFIELQAGEMEVHHPNIVHRSARNTSQNRRAGVALAYMPTECLFVRDKRAAGDELGGLDLGYGTRPLFLVRGECRNGDNAFVVDARP
ncbi:unnamed protein product [Symbiodinium natans]|uniref:Phytanoyl-CoA dioxygenase n=1 Tax=Symbiodinium natans TaxID=878477 RepID=A0A812VAE5_9DINO|nr:unnamed protein product [Symbiodinium natans]